MGKTGLHVKLLANVVLSLVLTLLIMGALTACGQSNQAGQSSQSAQSDQSVKAEAEASEMTIAVEDERVWMATYGKDIDSAIKIEVENAADYAITGVCIRPSGGDAFSDSILVDSSRILVGWKALLCFDLQHLVAEQGLEALASTGTPTDLVFNELYDLQIKFFDSSVIELHSLNLKELAAIKIFVSPDGFGYVECLTVSGKIESTLESERALWDEELARVRAEEEAAARAAAEAEAAALAAAEEAAAAQYWYDYGGSTGGSTGGQTTDQCVDDLVFR